MAKQAELEELLLLLSQEKGKVTAGAQKPSSNESYDTLYGDLGNEESGDDDTQSVYEPEVAVARGVSTKAGPDKACSKHTRQPGSPPYSKDRRVKSLGKQHAPVKRSFHQKKRDEGSESFSSDDAMLMKVRKLGKIKAAGASPFLAWEGNDQSTRMMARRALGRISASPHAASQPQALPSSPSAFFPCRRSSL